MFGHRYFDLAKLLGGQLPRTLDEIALALKDRNWE
jgi:hypothetical protein